MTNKQGLDNAVSETKLIMDLLSINADLLAALESIANLTDGHPVDADRRDLINAKARTAIAKAKGE